MEFQSDYVQYHCTDHIGILKLNRPDKRNALNLKVWRDIGKAVAFADKDDSARIVLLTGEGKSFCAGLDLSPDNELIPILMQVPSASQKLEFYKIVRELQDIHTRLERLRQPTIAVIHGHCLGAGLELALCCDFRLCSADAIFALPEAKLAIITDVGGLQRISKVVGRGHARELTFRGHSFDADKAKSMNLVNEMYDTKEALYTAAMKIAREIADNPPLAVQGAKDVILSDENVSLEESLAYNAARSAMIMPSEDLSEAISAYMQKRPGKFKGA